LLRIGSEDLAYDPYVLSGINDLRIDAADNVYALDREEFMIKVFSPTGKYIKTYKEFDFSAAWRIPAPTDESPSLPIPKLTRFQNSRRPKTGLFS